MSWEVYYKHLIVEVEAMEPSKCIGGTKKTTGAVSGGVIGGFVGTIGGPLGNTVGAIVGFGVGLGLGWYWANEHYRLVAGLNDLPESEKIRLVGVVQGVVGGSNDFNQVAVFIDNGNTGKLRKALKTFLKERK